MKKSERAKLAFEAWLGDNPGAMTWEQLDRSSQAAWYCVVDAVDATHNKKKSLKVSNEAIALMQHALGVQPYPGGRWSKPYRNHFCAGASHAVIWDELVEQGLALKMSDGNLLTGGNSTYRVSDAGREVALAGFVFKKRWGYRTETT